MLASGAVPVSAEEDIPAESSDSTAEETTAQEYPEEPQTTAAETEDSIPVPEETEETVPPETTEEENTFEVITDINPMYTDFVYEEDLEEQYDESFEAGETNELLNASRTCSSVNEAAVWVRSQMKARASEMTVVIDLSKSAYSDANSAFSTAFHQILDGAFQHTGIATEGDYLYWHYAGASAGGSYRTYTNYWHMTMNLTVRFNSTTAQENAVTSAVNSITASLPVDSYASDYDKAYCIHEWITRNVKYTSASDYSTNMYYHTAYSAAVDKSTVCQGYSLLFYRLALMEGLECRIVAGDGSASGSAPHGWNIVRVDGKWYNIDSTWDAGQSAQNWDYFLAPKYPFGNDHRPWSTYTAASFANSHAVSTAAYSTSRLSNVKNFVRRLYTNCLGRNADTKGLNSWAGFLYTQKGTAAQAVTGFFNSKEYMNKKRSDREFIGDCYRVLLDRTYDASGMNSWLSVLADYMSRTYVLRGFAGSAEFAGICSKYGVSRGTVAVSEGRDLNRGITRFVVRLYRETLGREPDLSGLNGWCTAIASRKMSAQTVSEGFFGSKEFENKRYSGSVFVNKLYHVFLDREPDPAGKNGWLNRLAQGMSRKTVVSGFARSAEFAKLMKSYGL